MTMHLAIGLTTTSPVRKNKPSLTKGQLKVYQQDLKEYNQRMKRQHRHNECMTLDDYINYRFGITSKAQKSVTTSRFDPQKSVAPYRRGDNSHIKSLDDGIGIAAQAEKKEYTGNLIKGIAQTHKSNAVPVINDDEIIAIRHMRR